MNVIDYLMNNKIIKMSCYMKYYNLYHNVYHHFNINYDIDLTSDTTITCKKISLY